MRKASAASMVSPVKASSVAFEKPTIRGNSHAPPSPGVIPKRTKLSANFAEVVDDTELMAAARKVANKIAANPPHAVRMTKRLLREGQTADLKNILEMSAAMQSLAHATADNDEAITAFLEKREPEFKGE